MVKNAATYLPASMETEFFLPVNGLHPQRSSHWLLGLHDKPLDQSNVRGMGYYGQPESGSSPCDLVTVAKEGHREFAELTTYVHSHMHTCVCRVTQLPTGQFSLLGRIGQRGLSSLVSRGLG